MKERAVKCTPPFTDSRCECSSVTEKVRQQRVGLDIFQGWPPAPQQNNLSVFSFSEGLWCSEGRWTRCRSACIGLRLGSNSLSLSDNCRDVVECAAGPRSADGAISALSWRGPAQPVNARIAPAWNRHRAAVGHRRHTRVSPSTLHHKGGEQGHSMGSHFEGSMPGLHGLPALRHGGLWLCGVLK